MEIVYKQTKELIPYVNNSRTHDEKQVNQIASSIKEFGFTNPLLIDEKDSIIAGHGRLMAANKLKMVEVPCIVLEGLTETQKKAYVIADNKLALNAGWDEELLKIEIEGLKELDFEIDILGFDSKEMDSLFLREVEGVEENFDETLVETRVKKGDVWKLGNHKLICGDSYKKSDIELLCGGVKADIVILDPPFDMEDDSWVENLSFAKNGCPTFLMASDKQTVRISQKIPNFRHFLIHDRVSAVMLNSNMPMSRHTIISFFCEHPGKYFRNLKDYFTTIMEINRNYKSTEKKECSKMGKPVEIPKKLIEHYSKPEDIVLSLFGGGGGDLIASEITGRTCYINELLPEQCDIIISRWEQLTGNIAEKIN